MSYKRVNRRTEGEVRQAILIHFLDARPVKGMQNEEPFKQWVDDQTLTWTRIKTVRLSMMTAGLLEQMRGTTADLVLRTTPLGKQAMETVPSGD